ncbi:MAG: MFS transporter [Eubacteriales bacterium]
MENLKLKNSVLLAGAIASFSSSFMGSSMNIALPAIQEEFSINAIMLAWLTTSYLLATAVALVPAGKIGDIYGRKKTLLLGIILFTVASFFSGFAPSIHAFLIMRIIQGIGCAIQLTGGMALLTSVFPPKERGRAIGINVSAVYIGLSAGPFLGGILTQHLGWRSIFFVSVPFGLTAIIMILKYIKDEWADAKGQSLDIIGSTIYGISLIALIYGATLLPNKTGIILISVSFIGIIAFIKRQLTVKYPVFEVRLFKNNRLFTFSSIAALINYSATTVVAFFLSLYLQYIKGFDPQTAGLVLIVQPILMAVISPYSGRLSDKIEPGKIASLGMALTSIGLFVLVFLGENSLLVHIFIAQILLGTGFALFSSPNTNAIMSSVQKQYYGIVSGSTSTMRLLGQMLSLATATVMFSIFIGNEKITPQNYYLFLKSLKTSFLIFACLCTIGIFFSYSRGKLRSKD